jgi:uncharacterized protein (UPF0335 family)
MVAKRTKAPEKKPDAPAAETAGQGGNWGPLPSTQDQGQQTDLAGGPVPQAEGHAFQDPAAASDASPRKRGRKPAPSPEPANLSGDNSRSALIGYVERFERLAEEKAAKTDDMRELMKEAKAVGFDPKIMRVAIRRRGMDTVAREAYDSMLSDYEDALK